jgi:hypothetical protein
MTHELGPLPEPNYLGDDVCYGYDKLDMRDYALAEVEKAVKAERERCKRIVQFNQYRCGRHKHDDVTIGHFNVGMISEIDSGEPPKVLSE